MKKINILDEEIILKAQGGDTEAFSQIYKAYYSRVYFVAYQYFRNEEVAKDIVQETFILVYRKLKQLNEPKTFPLWIKRVTYSLCVNQSRKKQRIVDLGESMDIDDFKDNKQVSAMEVLENERIREIIFESLEMMGEPMKSVGLLRYYEGLQIKEIAEVLQVPKGTVNSRMDSIRKQLRVDLERNGISPKNFGVIISPTVIAYAYQLLSKQYTLNTEDSVRIYNAVIKSGAFVGTALLKKLVIGGVLIASVVTGVVVFNQQPETVVTEDIQTPQAPKESVAVEETAKFLDINYNANWTNEAIELSITTTNDNYDQILVNGVDTTIISENGEYLIKLLKGNEELDTKILYISNIDIYSPNATYTQADGVFTYYLSDDASNINIDSILFYRDGVLSNDYEYNSQEHILIIKRENKTMDQFLICDYAGNELEIIIQHQK
ncbi:RNA polymerase sigma factor [Breznakia pachnodae]|uniref:RNA polymerase sigma factor (Sigma-70 family) n=1 Tax=Breznakia pachnodae TaxID=265178 RepID=A0ABU0E6Z0_9FIRM|nr:RNA polymerase sigma factor [Breznakia pachnodae]MDQ0362635.1 RNA polymerase sigma factor (sigma-70 family) [Breznakia pachnodae]